MKAKLNKLASKLGVTLNWKRETRNTLDGFQFDGVDIACKNMEYNIVVHELAHYAIASPKAKVTPNYGLGNLNGYKHKTRRFYSAQKAQQIEDKAIALTLIWCRKLKMHGRDITKRFIFVDSRTGKASRATIEDLQRTCIENNSNEIFQLSRLL